MIYFALTGIATHLLAIVVFLMVLPCLKKKQVNTQDSKAVAVTELSETMYVNERGMLEEKHLRETQ